MVVLYCARRIVGFLHGQDEFKVELVMKYQSDYEEFVVDSLVDYNLMSSHYGITKLRLVRSHPLEEDEEIEIRKEEDYARL